MGINPPSDIVLDVSRAADPARYQAAVQRLTDGAAPTDAASFSAAFEEAAAVPTSYLPRDIYEAQRVLRSDSKPGKIGRLPKAHQQLEAMMMQTFIEAMMPKAQGSFYGKGTAGQVWKSFAAEQIAVQMARAGGIGIASRVLDSRAASAKGDAL